MLGLRLSTLKRLLAHWVLHACAEVEENTSITTKAWRHLSRTFEEAPRLAARATREHLNGTLFDETEVEQEEPPEEADLILHDDDDDDDTEDPESTGQLRQKHLQLFQKHLSRFRQWLPNSHAQNASCICAARTASIHQSHELFSGTMQGPKVRLHRACDAVMRPGQASLQPPRSCW